MIYFDRRTQEQLVRQLCRFLAPKGYLLIGHSESLNGLDVPRALPAQPSILPKERRLAMHFPFAVHHDGI